MLSKENFQPWEILARNWVNAFQQADSSAKRQLACYRFILALFQSPLPCYHLDCRHITLTQGDPQKQEDLQDFLQWVGAYWPLQAINFHPEDGVVPQSVQHVLQEHQFLQYALKAKLCFEWLYFAPYLEDIIQQAYLTSLWLLDSVGMLMAEMTPAFITKVSDWFMDEKNETIFVKIEQWPKILNRLKDKAISPEDKTASVETEQSLAWRLFERELGSAFSTVQITVQEKMQRILQALQDPKIEAINKPSSLNDYVVLYQSYEEKHHALLTLSPSSLSEYQPIQKKSSVLRSLSLSFLFTTKPVSASLQLPYDSLPETYREAVTLSIPFHTTPIAPFDTLIPRLIDLWELPDATQKACLSIPEQGFILHSLSHPTVGRLSFEPLSLSSKGQENFWFFLEQLLHYNPHISDINIPDNWSEIPQNIQTLLNKNQQWKAALYYASLGEADYKALGFSATLSDVKKHRQNLARAYEKTALPWIQNTLKSLKTSLSPQDFESLAKEIQENYLPTIKSLSAHKKTPPLQASMGYDVLFHQCKPIAEPTLSNEILVASLSFH